MPELLIIAGPNGAGKTTAAHVLLPEMLPNARYINADYIAAGMNPLQPERSAIAAGRVMLKEIKSALQNNEDFAFETTLATRGFVRLIRGAKQKGYRVSMLYFWLNDVVRALERVAQRVQEGGHHVPDIVVKRRYKRSVDNLVNRYLSELDAVSVYDNSTSQAVLIAQKNGTLKVLKEDVWEKLKRS